MTLNETDILQKLHRGDKSRAEAFTDIVRHFSRPLYWQIRRMVTWHDDADDVLQNTLLKAWNGIDNFRGDSRLSTWLFRIAYNECITFLSKQHDNLSLDTAFSDDEERDALTIATRLQGDSYFDGDNVEALLQAAIATLPPKQRAVFNMKYYDDMKYDEISNITGTSVGALKASYHTAVKKIEDFVLRHTT